jgi:DNA (cytosine-5)-methyltransferase 1
MANGPTQKEIREGNPKSRIEVEVMLGETNWGRFGAAIRRWEEVIGRPAPKPTKPDGKDGGNRLSSLFTEWLMGLPEGWITGLGLKRNDELKLAGNGVVPQQAELALRILLEDDNLLERIKK